MNKKEIEKMISLADDSYIEEMFTTKLYERKRHGAAWIAAAAAVAVAVGAAGIAINFANSDKIVAGLQDIITDTETDTSALENAVSTDFLQYRINCGDYFKNKPDDEAHYYYYLLEEGVDITSYDPVYRFSAEYLDSIVRFEREDFHTIEGGLQCDENDVPLHADIKLYNDDTVNLPMVHMVFYSDSSNLAHFDKSPYSPEIFGVTELYGFDLSEEKDGSKLLACWKSGDTNYMFSSRGIGYDKFMEIIGAYTESSEGDFTLDSFDLNSGTYRSVSSYKGASEMNSSSVFAGYIPDSSPFAGLSLYGTPQDQNYGEVTFGGETVYRRYRHLLVDPESYEIGNGSEKIYISLIYEWGEEPYSDTVSSAPVIPFEEITPEKLDEIRIDEESFGVRYMFVIPVNDFTITVIAACDREQLLEAVEAIRISGEVVEQLTLAEANANTPFTGYIPQSAYIESLSFVRAVRDTSKREELRVQYRGEENGRETEYVHFYYCKDGTMPSVGYYGTPPEGWAPEKIIETPYDQISVQKLEEVKKFGSGDLTKHSFYLVINEAEFYIRVEAVCSSEKLMKFFEDMPNYEVLQNSGEINSQTVSISTEPTDSDDDTVMYDGRKYYRSMLSEETLKWLDWYNSLSEEERLAVSYEPQELSYLQYKF